MQNPYLELDANIGLNCVAKNSLVIHPSELFMIYATGSLLTIKSVDGSKDVYLQGHSAKIHCITCSKKGNMIASGEGHDYRSEECGALIVWDFNTL